MTPTHCRALLTLAATLLLPIGSARAEEALCVAVAAGPYARIAEVAKLLAVRSEDKDVPWITRLVKAFQSSEVKKLVESRFSGSRVPAF
jgi:D-methionine transport system substrate-binding protein